MCFEVITNHYFDHSVVGRNVISNALIHTIIVFGGIATPLFMIMAFYFTDIVNLACDKVRIWRRLQRLIIPHLFWSISYFAVYYVVDKAWDFELEHGIKDLGLQLLLGHCLNQSEWFQVDLIIITVLFATLFKYLKPKWGGIILLLGSFAAIVMQYSDLNVYVLEYIFIRKMHSELVPYTIGRFAEMFPYAAIGVWMCRNALR